MPNFSPLRYPGGKYKTSKYIKHIVELNNCSTYIEPFAGGSAVSLSLLIEGSVKKIILNDYDKSIYCFWKSVLDHTDELIYLVNSTSVDMKNWYLQKEIQQNKEQASTIELGFSTLFLNRTNRSGIIKAGVIGGKSQIGNYKLDCRFQKDKIIDKIKLISSYRECIELYNLDAIDFITKVIKRTRKSFTFFDPPYFEKGPSLYTNFYNENDHLKLSKTIQQDLKNRKWIVTYDNSSKIKDMYHKLEYFEYSLNYSAQNRTQGIEYMFFSNKTAMGTPESFLKVNSLLQPQNNM